MPTDVLLGVEIGLLLAARRADVLRPVQSDRLAARIPAAYRDEVGFWYGLTARAHVILYARERASPTELDGYETLAEPRWRGRLCMESATGADSHLLLAVLLAHWGFERTLEWARGLVANLAREFQRDARGRLRALAAGICDVTVAGVQDLARLSRSELPEDQIAARRIGLRWPDQDGWGAVVTIGGAEVTRLTREPDAARQLLEFLTDGDAQRLLAGRLDDYPVALGIPVAGALVEWGAFQADPTGLTALDQQADAVARIIALSGWK